MAKKKTPLSEELKPAQKEIKKLNEKLAAVDLLQPDQKSLEASMNRMHSVILHREKNEHKATVAQKRKDFIQAINHATKRAYKELPQFFKFRLFKNQPQRIPVKDKQGEYLRPTVEPINFRGLVGEVTYFVGELGDTDRMVYLAILNESIRHKEFVKEFGRIPFSMDELADKAGLAESGRRAEIVEESLIRLMRTELFFKNGTGGAYLKDRFHLIEHYTSLEKAKAENEVNERLTNLQLENKNALVPAESGPDVFVTYFKTLQGQAEGLFAKFKPRTPQLTLITFNKPLMDAINGEEITTVDMWALQRLKTLGARSLYLYLYDVSQWRDSKKTLEIPLRDLMQLMDLKPNTSTKNGLEYTWWKHSVEQVKGYMEEVNQVAQFIEYFEWSGEGEQTLLQVQLCKDVPQISPF